MPANSRKSCYYLTWEDLSDTVLVGQIRSSVLNRLSLRNLLDFQGEISNRQVTKPSSLEENKFEGHQAFMETLSAKDHQTRRKVEKVGKRQKMRSYYERN